MQIDLTKEEIAAILVGMVEFDNFIHDNKKSVFVTYQGICGKLIEKFRKLNWECIENR